MEPRRTGSTALQRRPAGTWVQTRGFGPHWSMCNQTQLQFSDCAVGRRLRSVAQSALAPSSKPAANDGCACRSALLLSTDGRQFEMAHCRLTSGRQQGRRRGARLQLPREADLSAAHAQ